MSSDFFDKIQDSMEQAKIEMGICNEQPSNLNTVIKVSPDMIGNWEYRDRQAFELGDIEELAKDILVNGQVQPIVITLADNTFKSIEDPDAKYVVIAGYRRWLACKSKNIEIDATLREFNIEDAISTLVSENKKEAVSDYSKGMFYKNILLKENISIKTLYERTGIKKSTFHNYLAFYDVPEIIWDAVEDLSKVSARTAAEIKLISQRGEAEMQALIDLAPEIASGAGATKLQKLVDAKLRKKSTPDMKHKNSTRVEFAKNAFIEDKKNGFRFDIKGVDGEKKEVLKTRIKEIIEEYI